MATHHRVRSGQNGDEGWIAFPGGELEGKRPKTLCEACWRLEPRARTSSSSAPLCFQCYRAKLNRVGQLDSPPSIGGTARHELDDSRWQWLLPFEPVNRPRLEMLRAERAAARAALQNGAGRFLDKRRQAQITARRALQEVATGLRARRASKAGQNQVLAEVAHAAELQLPEAWLPFVVSQSRR